MSHQRETDWDHQGQMSVTDVGITLRQIIDGALNTLMGYLCNHRVPQIIAKNCKIWNESASLTIKLQCFHDCYNISLAFPTFPGLHTRAFCYIVMEHSIITRVLTSFTQQRFVSRENNEIIPSSQQLHICISEYVSTHNFNIHSPSKITVQLASATVKTLFSAEAIGDTISKANNKV